MPNIFDFNPTNINPFPYWKWNKVLPAVYDDSLSQYEILCKLLNVVNNIIDSTNSTGEQVEQLTQLVQQLIDGGFPSGIVQYVTDIVNAVIDDDIAAINAIIDNIQSEIGNIHVYLTSKLTNAEVGALSNAILIIDGNLLNVTIPETVYAIPAGGVLSGNVVIHGTLAPVLIKVFENASISGIYEGYPEWFGAITDNATIDNAPYITASIAAFNVTTLQERDYNIDSTITINRSNVVLRCNGHASSSYGSTNEGGCRIVTDDDITALKIIGTSNYSITQVHLLNIGIFATTLAARGIDAQTVRALYLERCIIGGFTTNVFIYGAVNHYYTKTRVFITNGGTNGFFLNTDAPIFSGSISPISTLMMGYCEVNCINGSNVAGGVVAEGTNGVADLNINNMNFVACPRGISLAGNSSNRSQQDVTLNENVIDNCIDGIYITGGISAIIADNWISVGAYGTGTRHAIWIENNGIGVCNIVGNQIKEAAANTLAAFALRVSQVSNVTFIGNTILDFIHSQVILCDHADGLQLESSVVNRRADCAQQCVRIESSSNFRLAPTIGGDYKYDYGIVVSGASNGTIDFSGVQAQTTARVRANGTNVTAAMCFNAAQADGLAIIGVI